jgi:hypothetical protein
MFRARRRSQQPHARGGDGLEFDETLARIETIPERDPLSARIDTAFQKAPRAVRGY